MTETSFPHDAGPGSIITEGQWSRMADGWQDDGVDAADHRSSDLKVTSNSEPLTLRVAPGRAHVAGFFYELNTDTPVTIEPNTTANPRIDLVALRVNRDSNAVNLVVRQGTPAVTPAAPPLDTSWESREVPLAHVTIRANSASVIPADVEDVRNFAGKRVVVCTAKTRPEAPGFGQIIYEKDTKRALIFTERYSSTSWQPILYSPPENYALPMMGKRTSSLSTQTITTPAAGSWYTANVGFTSNWSDTYFDNGLSIFSNSQGTTGLNFINKGVAHISAYCWFITSSAAPTQARLINAQTSEVLAEAMNASGTTHKFNLSAFARVDGEVTVRMEVGVVSGTVSTITVNSARMAAAAIVSGR